MRNWKYWAWLGCTATLLAGCQSGPWPSLSSVTPWKSQTQLAQNQQLELVQQNREQQARLNNLNQANEQLYKVLAESQQDATLHKAENDALREQLRGVTAQLQGVQSQTVDNQRKFDNLLASVRRRGGAIIEPNNSLRDNLPVISIPGVEVRREGEQVRVDIAAAQLFAGEDAQLTPGGAKLLEATVDELDRRYPGHRVGIEAHVDNQPLQSARWANHHQLTLARANAVFNYLVSYTRLRAEQLTVGGYGSTRPFASNANPAAQQRNRRVELVVYPERVGNSARIARGRVSPRLVRVSERRAPTTSVALSAAKGRTAPREILRAPPNDNRICPAADCDALLVVSSRVPGTVIEQLSRCRVIAPLGAGTDRIDVAAATRCGIIVANAPHEATRW